MSVADSRALAVSTGAIPGTSPRSVSLGRSQGSRKTGITGEPGTSKPPGSPALVSATPCLNTGAFLADLRTTTRQGTTVGRALFALLLTLVAAPASADIRIMASPGGQIGGFVDLFKAVRDSGERVVIDGPCLSACTLALSVLPRSQICVTRRAALGFHAVRSIDRFGRTRWEPEASAAVLDAYPGPVRSWIMRHGGLTPRLIVLRGRELAAMYPRCR
jgi:hypothetical protein